MLIPYLKSDYQTLFTPERYGNYVNDHTLFYGDDGLWHFIGITGFDSCPVTERYFVRADGETLGSPLHESTKLIDRGTLAWSPCVIRHDGFYYMYYGPSPTAMAVSPELNEWFNYNIRIENEPPMAVHRDHFVLEIEPGHWLMYASGILDKRGCISLLESDNLINWRFVGYALTSDVCAPLTPPWGAFESPYVVKKDAFYYLFVTYTDCSDETYNDTLVFASDNPRRFGSYTGGMDGTQPITKLYAHAPEIVSECDNWFITTCGWNGKPNPNPGSVSIAELGWRKKIE